MLLWSAEFFQNQLFHKIISGMPLEWRTVWIQIVPEVLSGLICVQTICKGNQEMTLGGKELTSSYFKLLIRLNHN